MDRNTLQSQTLVQNPRNFAMENFQRAVFNLVESQPNAPLTPAARTLLQDRLNQFASRYKTPDHPPYAAMIERALRELNEKRGSTEESISQFLRKEYENLPWSHSVLLNHHLSKLCDSGDIIATRHNTYMLPWQIPNPKSTTKVKRKPQRRLKWDWERERNKCRKRLKKTKGGKVGVSAKHQETKKEEEQKVGVSAKHQECDGEEEQKVVVSATHQEFEEEEQKVGVSAKHKKSNEDGELKITENGTLTAPYHAEEHNLSSPERPPGFEFVRVDNLSPNLDKMEVEVASSEEFAKSKRDLRQKRRLKWKFPVKLENRPKLEEKKDHLFSKERKPRRRRRGRPNFESYLDLLGPEYDLPKRANGKQKPIKLDCTNEYDNEVEEKQVRKRGRPRGWKQRMLEQEPDDHEESTQSCSPLCEKMVALKTEERPQPPRTRQTGGTPKRRSPRLQKLE